MRKFILTAALMATIAHTLPARAGAAHAHLAELGFADFVQRSSPAICSSRQARRRYSGVCRAVKNRLVSFAREVVKDLRSRLITAGGIPSGRLAARQALRTAC
jgi:hypothetical protein